MAVVLVEEVAREGCLEVAASCQSQALMVVKAVMVAWEALVASQANGLTCVRTLAVVQEWGMEDCFRSDWAALTVLVGPAYPAYLEYPAYLAYSAYPVASCQASPAGLVGTAAACPCTCPCDWRHGLAKSFFFVALLDFHRSVTLVELMA